MLKAIHSDRPLRADAVLAGAAPAVQVIVLAGRGMRRSLESVRSARCETAYSLVIGDPGTTAAALGMPPLSHVPAAPAGEVGSCPPGLSGPTAAPGWKGTRELACARERDLVLLWPGTEVHGDWLDRLRAAAYAEPHVASVSPLCSAGNYRYPTPGEPCPAALGDWAALDRIAAGVNRGHRLRVPGAGDCCVYLRRDYLDQGARLAEAGGPSWQHLVATDVCVSVSPAEAPPAGTSLDGRVVADPTWPNALACFLKADPGRPFRRNLDLGLLGGPQPAVLFITHIGGGGTERHVRTMADALEREGMRSIIFRPDGRGRVRLERLAAPFTPNLLYDPAREYHTLLTGLRRLGVAHVHVQHLVGHAAEIFRLVRDLGLSYDMTLHDYYLACPRAHLSDNRGRYCQEPDAEGCNACLARHGDYYGVRSGTDITQWRARHAPWLAGARKVFVPHADVGRRLQRYFPDIEFTERRHFETLVRPRPVAARYRAGEVLRVALLGVMMEHKGVDVLLACAEDAARRGLAVRFQVIGPAARAAELVAKGNVEVTGEYREEEVFDLLERHACHCALFLSIVPETYCYTLSIALAGGLYPLGFDLGAQGCRIREAGWGEVFPLGTPPDEINDRLLRAAARLEDGPAAPRATFARYDSMLRDYYELDLSPSARPPLRVVAHPPEARPVGRPRLSLFVPDTVPAKAS